VTSFVVAADRSVTQRGNVYAAAYGLDPRAVRLTSYVVAGSPSLHLRFSRTPATRARTR